MRILIWATFFPPHVGGYEKNVLELSQRLVERGHQVDVVTCQMNSSLASEQIGDVGVIRVPSLLLLRGLFPVPLPSKILFNTLLKCSYDITVTQTRFFILSFIGAVFSALHRIPLVHVERGSCHTVVESSVVGFVSKVYDHTVGRWVVQRAKRVIGISRPACAFIKHLGVQN